MSFKVLSFLEMNFSYGDSKYLKLFTIVLLILHALWVSTHLFLVSKDLINPWKLGGYGMYTVPHDKPRIHVFLQDGKTKLWKEFQNSGNGFVTRNFEQLNHNNVFRCRFPSERSLIGFLDENPHLTHKPIVIAVSKIVFSRYPIKVERQMQAKIEIAWSRNREWFGYRGNICGRDYSGKVKYN